MSTDDPHSYTYGEIDEEPDDLWNYGIEKWCNMDGQYMTLVSDLTHLKGQDYEMSICSLGVMGVEYVRD